MNTSNYWYFKSALTPKFCDDVIKYGLSKSEEMAKTGNTNKDKLSKEEIRDIRRIRNSNIVWLDEPWIYREIHPYVHKANENAGWNFDLDISEDIQFTEYSKSGHYDWHVDGGSDHNYVYTKEKTKWPNYYGKVRKLSMTVNLSDENDYEGGDLIFKFNSSIDGKENTEVCKPIRKKGTIVVFPSFIHHKITPINSGNRYSLVMWTLGKPFR